ncbi:MAG: hypothetical protein M1812_005998 [Candelaria pacifica]|nr:MAG: hypothetical protein M1812_005998 [Candelaria pacifica]
MVRIALPNRLSSYSKARHSDVSNPSTSPGQAMGDQRQHDHSPHLILQITVVRGRNLAAKDKNGTSDPYLVITLGEARESTPTISKTLNPEWNVTFEFPISDVHNLLLEGVCWDKDRIGKDYMGEFDIALEDVFANEQIIQEPQWYTLKSKHKGSKKSVVSGEVQLKFSIIDPTDPSANPHQILRKFFHIAAVTPGGEEEEEDELARLESGDADTNGDKDEDTSDETDDPSKPGVAEKRKKKLRLARLKKKTKARAYEFTGGSDCVGIVFIEIAKITDLPPERNMTRTSFDMDPFVVVSLGKKTFRTRVIRHNLNPVFDEKMVFQVLRHEQNYSLNFAVVDRDKLSGNDFVGTTNFALQNVITTAPEADPDTGLYHLLELVDPSTTPTPSRSSRFKLPMSRSSSSSSLNRLSRPSLKSSHSSNSVSASSQLELPPAPTSVPPTIDKNSLAPVTSGSGNGNGNGNGDYCHHADDPDLRSYIMPLNLKNKDRWEAKHSPELFIKAKYLPYTALRQQFWRAMLKQYDADDSGRIDKVELTTMLDTLGSTLKESTIESFFKRFATDTEVADPGAMSLSFDQAVVCLEDQLQQSPQKKTWGDTVHQAKDRVAHAHHTTVGNRQNSETDIPPIDPSSGTDQNFQSDSSVIPAISQDPLGADGGEGNLLDQDDLAEDDKGEEHVIEIRECPICHQPRLNKRSDADIITHIATCASQDWRQVNNIVMAGFVTSSQAQRKWYSKVITKIGYGGYKLGANSANTLVQDRLTGQINEERMSVYVRLGIRLLYKGLKSREMERKRIRKLLKSLSVKQGKKYDDPASAREIATFVQFHQLDMSEVLLPMSEFNSFNQFFYRALKPTARPCSAPDNPKIIVSPADCRSVVFNRMDDATRIWVKGREFSVERLLGNAYPEDAKRYANGALGIFRLAPQDYHRFHIPVDGIMDKPKLIEGEYYTVNPMAIRSALDVYGENIRVVVPINSVAHGRVMVICVGAMMVGSTVITRKTGEKVRRAEELGYFKFGGSTLLLLFEPGVMQFDDDMTDNSNGALETLIRVGMSIGHHPEQAQYTPDMRKENVTNEEKQEAKRRIEGSMAPMAANLG